jgi:hypothetical protein
MKKTFNTTIYFNGQEFEATVVGYLQPYERWTLESPEVKAQFEIEQILIEPTVKLGEIDLMSEAYCWSFTDMWLQELEKDCFSIMQGEENAYL